MIFTPRYVMDNTDFFEDKKEKKQRNPLAVVSVVLLIIAALLTVVLIDMCYVPSGELWEEMKAYGLSYEDGENLSDAELWERIKEDAVFFDVIPFKSGFLCWNALCEEWDRMKNTESTTSSETLPPEQTDFYEPDEFDRNKAEAEASIAALMIKDRLSEEFDGHRITDITLQLYITNGNADITASDYGNKDGVHFFASVDNLFPAEEFSFDELGAAFAVIKGGRCTAVAFSPGMHAKIVPGIDCPLIGENGRFDFNSEWSGENPSHGSHFVVGLGF